MVARKEIAPAVRTYVLCNRHKDRETVMEETGISRASYFRIIKENTADTLVRSENNRISGGRPKKLSNTDVRQILRQVIKLRETLPNWTAKRLMVEALHHRFAV